MRYSKQSSEGSKDLQDDVNEDEVSHRDPVIYRTPEDALQGEERVDIVNQQHPMTPSRFQRQNPSWQGRVAYVIYGGIGNESGIYYNWASCEAVIKRYFRNFAPPFVGFNTELEARDSYESFQSLGQLPQGIFFPPSLRPLIGSPVPLVGPLQPRTPQRRNRPPTSQSPHTAVSQSPSTLPPTSRLVSPIQCNLVPASTQACQPPRLVATSSLPLLAHINENSSFYVVVEGHAPGIYGTQAAALHARGFHESNVTVYTTRDAANQAFVDAYMTGRVCVAA